MPELLRWQADFAQALRDRARTPELARWLAGDDALVDRRLALYRASMVAAADKALTAAYPVIAQVVGPEFFHGLAREVQRATPSTSGDLAAFGAGLADFLAGFEHARDMPWLPDLARLEWAAHVAYGAADAPPWDAAALAAVPPERQEAIRLRWTPGLAVIESSHPIVRVWTLHQPGHDGEFSVDWTRGETALVARAGFTVVVEALSAGAATFIRASLADATLGDAAAAALAHDPDFDLGALLAQAFAAGRVGAFTL